MKEEVRMGKRLEVGEELWARTHRKRLVHEGEKLFLQKEGRRYLVVVIEVKDEAYKDGMGRWHQRCKYKGKVVEN